MNTYEQEMIEVDNKNERIRNKDIWNSCNHMPMFPLLGANHRLLLLNMKKRFIWIKETGERIDEFDFGYIINPNLHVNKSFIDQVEKCMNTTFGALTQNFIKTTL